MFLFLSMMASSDVMMYFPFQVQYATDLPHLVSSYSRDPLNVKLKSHPSNRGKSWLTCAFIN